jgi:hypothetical protein
MARTINSELQDLLDLKNNGAINEEEFNQLKQVILSKTLLNPERTGVGWQEIVAVLFGILGGIIYVVGSKQRVNRKAIVFSIAFFWNGICAGINPSTRSLFLPSNPIQNANPVIAISDSSPNLLKSGDFEFSNATAEPYNYSGSADVAGRLVKVGFDAKNITNKSAAPASHKYILKDSQEREFETAAWTIGLLDEKIKKRTTDNILPGSINRVSLIFDVAKDTRDIQLGIAHIFGDKKWLKVAQTVKTPIAPSLNMQSDKGEDKSYSRQPNENIDKPNNIKSAISNSSISRDVALDTIRKYLKAKTQLFAPPYNKDLGAELLTGKIYQDKIDKGNSECNDPDNCLSSIDWLIKYNGQYSYENQYINSIDSFESDSNTATITLTITESRILHQSGKNTQSGETSQSTFDLIYEDGTVKILDIRNR